MINRRPKASDTEEDLLAFQDSFLSSGKRPSASLKVQTGEKRKSTEEEKANSGRRDFVVLESEDAKELEIDKPQAKRSKFRERRDLRVKHEPEDVHEAMESQDMHITKVLADIQEHGEVLLGSSSSALLMMRRAKSGFPVVHQLDLTSLGTAPPSSEDSEGDPKLAQTKRKHKKKSLFAEHFEHKEMSFFGIDSQPLMKGIEEPPPPRDYVEPISIGIGIGNQTADMEQLETTKDVETNESMEYSESKMVKKEFESDAARMWDRFTSSLISGDGLKSVGATDEGARSDIGKIHQENVERLSKLSEEEILKEKEQIEQALGSNLVKFLKSRQDKMTAKDGMVEGDMEHPVVGEDEEEDSHASSNQTTDQLVPPKGWVHMDVVEREKLEWMTDVAPPSAQPDLDKNKTRFSLDGLVIPRSTAIPMHLGLHHHGDEPEAAGYTLEELLPLCRSTVLQQRVLGLQTLSKVIHRARHWQYKDLVEESVMEALLRAGLPLLLRYALDDNTEAVAMAAVQALHSLLVSSDEEVLLEEYSLCCSGCRLPNLKPTDKPHEEKEKKEEKSDAEILQRDIVEGYLKMNLLPRMRYILEVLLPQAPPTVHVQVLEILTRIARHSMAAATQVLQCPRLMQVVFEQYLPLSWSDEGGRDTVIPRPVMAAIRLVRALCTAGRTLASHLISDHGLVSVLTCYTTLHPTEQNLPVADAYPLAIASLSAWQVLLSYGYADEAFRDIFPVVFLKQVQLLSSVTELSDQENKRISILLGVAESAICLAAVTPEQLKVSGRERLPAPAVDWSHATGMAMPLIHALISWTTMDVDAGPRMIDKVLTLGSLLNIVATYHSKLREKVGERPLKVLEQVEMIVAKVVNVLPGSSIFSMALHAIRDGCDLDDLPSEDSDLSPLPSHFLPPMPTVQALYGLDPQKIKGNQQHLDCLQSHIALMRFTNFVLGYIRLTLACIEIHKGMLNAVSWIFTDATFQGYLRKALVPVIECREPSLITYLKVELIYCSIKLFTMWTKTISPSSIDSELVELFHKVSYQLVVSLLPGSESKVHDLLLNVLFHQLFYSDSSLEGYIMNISLKSPVQQTTKDPQSLAQTSKMMSEAHSNLTSVKVIYTKTFQKLLERKCCGSSPLQCNSLLVPSKLPLLPSDWVLSPLAMKYKKSLAIRSDVSDAQKEEVKRILSYLLLLECSHPHLLARLNLLIKLARLMCVFLLDNDFFLEPPIHSLLYALLKLYCREGMQSLDLNSPIPDLPSFTDLYISFLEHFSAVSYGDHLFGCFVLLPLQQRLPVHFRRMVWGDYPQVLRILSVPLDQLPLDLKLFLYPAEADENLLEKYLSALATALIKKTWSPLLYLVAVHHVHSFVFNVKEYDGTTPLISPLQKKMLLGLLYIKDKAVKRDLLLYGGHSTHSITGFELLSKMTNQVKACLEVVAGNISEEHL